MDRAQFMPAIKQICEEKGIAEETVFETIEAAMASAYRKDYGEADWKIKADFDPETGETKFFRVFDVVSEVESEQNQLDKKSAKKELKQDKSAQLVKAADLPPAPTDEEARSVKSVEPVESVDKVETGGKEKKIKKSKKSAKSKINVAEEGDQIITPLKAPEDYGRIAAQTAKQVVIQRIREAERDVLYAEYKKKAGEILNGVVQQLEGRNVICDLGRANGILFPVEQIPNERYYVGQRLKVYIVSVDKTSKAPLIALSRAHTGLIKRLFELEVPEINAGSVEIKDIAREAGRRTKMSVVAHQDGVDPVGSCVGQRGTRVQAVLAEIGDEKIDIIEYQETSEKYIEAALSPAKVLAVKINKKMKTAKVQVDQEQLSLAIGREGQNVRLASKLTGFEIDVDKGDEEKKKAEKKVDKVEAVEPVKPVEPVELVKSGDKVDKVSKVENKVEVKKGKKIDKVKKVSKKKPTAKLDSEKSPKVKKSA